MSDYKSPMQILALLLLFLSLANPLYAQYTGGKGSGYAMAELSMITYLPRQEHLDAVKLWPNPAKPGEQVALTLQTTSNQDMQISLIDARGKELLKSAGPIIQLPEYLTTGTYIVSFRHSGIINRQKLIIQ
ncbi:MAG: T9SS type A sorting domain-containing protein [Cyclobacteriaceae bacterium]|nr:T9SS type A sorting domain-containing protein [Cyclobacteriaceae bacterium]